MFSRPVQRRLHCDTYSRSFLSRYWSISVCEFLFVILGFVTLVDSSPWGYGQEGDKDWKGLCESGRRQSPVDLTSKNAHLSTSIEPIAFIHYNQSVKTNITNNGHTVVLNLDQGQKEVGMAAGGLHGYYVLDSIHFHWGGSEHTFSGQRLAMEVHLVHYSADYASLSEAKDKPRGLAVIGVAVHETDEDNPLLAPLIESLSDAVDDTGETTALPEPFSPLALLPLNTSVFYRYTGSLTTPPCYESVEWSVLYRTVAASRSQLEKFKRMKSPEGLAIDLNFRRTRPQNERRILLVKTSQYSSIYTVDNNRSAGGRRSLEHSGLLAVSLAILACTIRSRG